MPLADHLPAPGTKGGRCTVTLARAEMPDETDRLTLDAWLADKSVTSARIAAALRSFGLAVRPSQHTIGRHRRQECRCDT